MGKVRMDEQNSDYGGSATWAIFSMWSGSKAEV